MKGILKLFPVALALIALASCSNDDLFEKGTSQAVNGKTMEASIEDFSVQTRAAFAENKNDEGKANKRALVWTVGDSYKVYGELATADQYTLQNTSAGKANGTFDLMTDDYNTQPAFAVFPYDAIEADRASKKLTVTLNDWTYGTATVKDEGYNQGAFKSVVPMYGIIGEDAGAAAFGYMTALLRVDLQKLPKKMTRLIVVTDRPLTGTFEAEFDPADKTTYPEIVSPVSNDKAKETYSFSVDRTGDGTINTSDDYTDLYFLAIGTESVNERTNKTFFIPVPTGNKYKTFDVLVEYNMGSSKKYEIVTQLGADYYGKVLKWERGKVKSLSKEITVTSGGNTPKAIAKFLADEWKSFPAEGDINITVTKANGDFAAIDLQESETGDNTFTIPAALKNRTVNIIVDESIAEGYTNATGKTLTIKDEDKAPVASDALRLINFSLPTATKPVVTIDAPESQIAFTTPEGTTAEYTSITAKVSIGDMTEDAAGLTIGEGVTVSSYARINDGSFLNAGILNNIRNVGDYDAKFTGNVNKIISDGDGNVTVVEANTGDIEINGDGALNVTGKADKSNTIGTVTPKGAGDISIESVNAVQIDGSGADFAGAITVDKVNTFKTTNAIANEAHAAEINISNVTNSTVLGYKGKGKVTLDKVKGNGGTDMIVVNQTANTQPFTATDLSGTFQLVKYNGTGNVDVEGVAAGVTLTDDTELKGGDVTLKNLVMTATGKKITKTGTGALVMESINLIQVDNAGGTISATGEKTTSVTRQSISTLTQKGKANVTLTNMYDVTTLNINEDANVDYENTYIGTFVLAANKKSTATGTKASGIGTATVNTGATFTPATDVWDGSVCPTQTTGAVYTSASLAALCGTSATTATLYLDLDMGGTLNFQDKATTPNKGIANAVTTFVGNSKKISNLKAETGLFKNRASGATLLVQNLTLENPVITATANAGGIVGIAEDAINLYSVTVKNITIASASTGKGTDINLGGFIGQVNAAGKVVGIRGGMVETAAIKGHYYMGGFIGQVVDAATVQLIDAAGEKKNKIGSQVKGISFTPISSEDWSTYKCGTIAPFIGGIAKITTTLSIYGKFDSFDREANMWKKNFLSNEDYKFMGTKRDDCNFIGYIDVIGNTPAFTYNLKHVDGFEAEPSMKIATTGDNGKEADDILATDCNVYAKY